jgi:nicotinic acid mononucleotide adenylyltransferase
MTRELNMFQKFIDNIPPELEKYQEKFRSGRVQFDPIPYSSSQIRREISEATFVDKDSLPTEVWNYITQTKLYN